MWVDREGFSGKTGVIRITKIKGVYGCTYRYPSGGLGVGFGKTKEAAEANAKANACMRLKERNIEVAA